MISFLMQSSIQFIISFWIFQDFIWLLFGPSCKWSCRNVSISAKLFNIAWKLLFLLSSLSSLSTSVWPRSAKPYCAHSATACMIRFSTWTFLSYLSWFSGSQSLFFLGSSNDITKLCARVMFSLWYFPSVCSQVISGLPTSSKGLLMNMPLFKSFFMEQDTKLA